VDRCSGMGEGKHFVLRLTSLNRPGPCPRYRKALPSIIERQRRVRNSGICMLLSAAAAIFPLLHQYTKYHDRPRVVNSTKVIELTGFR